MKLTLKPSVGSDRFPWVVVVGDAGKFITAAESKALNVMRAAYWQDYHGDERLRQYLSMRPGNLFYFDTEEEGMIFVLRWSGYTG